jgi:hypothetical protein
MNNLYRKIAVTSVGIALSFSLGVNKEAKAATITLTSVTSIATQRDGNEWSYYSGSRLFVSDSQAFYEFNTANLSLDPNTIISAIFQVKVHSFDAWHRYAAVGYSSYIADGQPGLSNSEIQNSTGWNAYENLGYPGFPAPNPIIKNFDTSVTGFVKARVRNRDAFTGVGLWLTTASATVDGNADLIITTVPEPTTIFGSALALSVGGWLKRKKSNPQSKIKSQP